LQNPADKREIICDERLKTILGNRDKVGMMEIAKLITPHFIKK
jgi:upstream activation factor subunit UAF30